MRADRLLSLLLLLQTKGNCSARELAIELGVSERTIYRDMTALSSAGVPVYAETGRSGGYGLVESYRTDLTGLSEEEAKALYMALLVHAIPAPLAELGVGDDLERAVRKLTAALPERFRAGKSRIQQRFILDPESWEYDLETPNLQAVQESVWEDRLLEIRYFTVSGEASEQVVEPYGLAAKAGVWYLVYARKGHFQARRVSSLLSALVKDIPFGRRDDFDLQVFWKQWVAARQGKALHFEVRVRIVGNFLSHLPYYMGEEIRVELDQIGVVDGDRWYTISLRFNSFEEARARLLSFGRAVEVLEPLEMRVVIQDYAEQILSVYR